MRSCSHFRHEAWSPGIDVKVVVASHDPRVCDDPRVTPFGRFEFFRINWFAGFNPFGLADFRDIDQHAAADHAVASDIDRTLVRALEINFGIVEIVVHLAAVEMMTQRIEMSGRKAMRFDREIIGAAP